MSVVDKPSVAADVMRTKITTITKDTHFSDAIAKMIRAKVSGLPIVDDDNRYLGMFSEKCGLRTLHEHGELIAPPGGPEPVAREAMVTKLVLLTGDQDVFDGISQLVSHQVSGAPVVDESQQFAGIFSEKTSMSVLTQAVFEGLQSAEIKHFANRDPNRIVDETTPLADVVKTFVDTEFRRLPVVNDGHVVGQVSRRDVLNHSQVYKRMMAITPETLGGDDSVLTLADTTAKTIDPELDLLSIISIFLNTPYRRLPVLKDGVMIGQISRRDVLRCVLDQSKESPEGHRSASLYLSALDKTTRFG